MDLYCLAVRPAVYTRLNARLSADGSIPPEGRALSSADLVQGELTGTPCYWDTL